MESEDYKRAVYEIFPIIDYNGCILFNVIQLEQSSYILKQVKNLLKYYYPKAV